MIKAFKSKSFQISFVLRHRWEDGSGSTLRNYTANEIKKKLQLGIWVKHYKAVGTAKGKSTFQESNLVNCFMIGLNLIVCKVWVEFSFKPTL